MDYPKNGITSLLNTLQFKCIWKVLCSPSGSFIWTKNIK